MNCTYDDYVFRSQFPEFSDGTKYPMALLCAYFEMAGEFISVGRSCLSILNGCSGQLALNMMTAHLYVLGAAQTAAADGPGTVQGGFETSASIGSISVSTLAPPVDSMWAWWLAQTPYGQMLLALLRVKSVGGTSVGGAPERMGFRKIGGVFW
jgi:hypothetical protein